MCCGNRLSMPAVRKKKGSGMQVLRPSKQVAGEQVSGSRLKGDDGE